MLADVADFFGQHDLPTSRGQALDREIIGRRPVALVLLMGDEGAVLLRQRLGEGRATGRLHLFHLLDVARTACQQADGTEHTDQVNKSHLNPSLTKCIRQYRAPCVGSRNLRSPPACLPHYAAAPVRCGQRRQPGRRRPRRYCRMISTRRLACSFTPSGVGTAGSLSPRPATVIASAGTPPAIKASRTESARRSDNAML